MTLGRKRLEIHGIATDRWMSGWIWSADLILASWAIVYIFGLIGDNLK